MTLLDELSPTYYGEDRIRLQLAESIETVRAFSAVVLAVDYSATLPAGIVLPLELTVTPPSGAPNFLRRTFRRLAPSTLAFTPREGGRHLVRLAELFHNHWVGFLELDVEGDPVREQVI